MKITIPDSWNEISISQYQDILSCSGIDRIACAINEDPEKVKRFDSQSMAAIINHLDWLNKTPGEDYYKTVVEIDGVEYLLVENLNRFSLGEWVDMEEYLHDFTGNLHLILAMLYRPVGVYKVDDVKARADLFREKLTIGDVYGSIVFFSLVALKSSITIPRYLIRQNLTQMRQNRKRRFVWLKKDKRKNGTGIATPTV